MLQILSLVTVAVIVSNPDLAHAPHHPNKPFGVTPVQDEDALQPALPTPLSRTPSTYTRKNESWWQQWKPLLQQKFCFCKNYFLLIFGRGNSHKNLSDSNK